MVKLVEFDQTAALAWSKDPLPLLAAGTLAGVMDDTLSSDSFLKIYDPLNGGKEVFTSAADAKYYSLDWSEASQKNKRGILAAGLENKEIHLYDVDSLLKGTSGGTLSELAKYDKHTTPVLQVKFNPSQQHILASSGSKGEIWVWDTNKGSSFSPGRAMSPVGKVSCLDWNNSVSHIFASAGDTGYTSIWDLKAKREVLQLTYSGASLSVVAWHPTQSTKLATASGDDKDPVILTWDLRNSSTPEKVLKGHRKAVLSLDWCKQDSTLLLSSGEDDTTMLWNPIEGVRLGEYPSLPNWVHQTRFAPRLPDVFASASLDKKIVVQTLQDTSPPVSDKVGRKSANDNDFWNNLSTTDTQQPVFDRKQAPQWLSRPVSASFGFGGKLVVVKKTASGGSVVEIESVPGAEKAESTGSLSTAIKNNNFSEICSEKLKQPEDEYKGAKDWKLLDGLLKKGQKSLLEEKVGKPVAEKTEEGALSGSPSDDDFFEQLGSATKANAVSHYAPTGEFKILSADDDEFTKKTVGKVITGQFEDALDLCVAENHILEALVLALNGTDRMKAKAKSAYFKKYADESSLARLLYSSSNNNVSDLVENADISGWKEIAQSIGAFDGSNDSGYNADITLLGDRLLQNGSRDDALACYMAGNAVGKVAEMWLAELDDVEKFYLGKSTDEEKKSLGSSDIRFKALSEVVEKVLVYEGVAAGKKAKSTGDLSALGAAFQEYAEHLASAGEFELALETLSKVPESAPGVKLEKERLLKALNKSATVATPASTLRAKPRYQAPVQSVNALPIPTKPYTNGRKHSAASKYPTYGNTVAPASPVAPAAVLSKPVARNPYAAASTAAGVASSSLSSPALGVYAPSNALESIRRGSLAPTTGSGIPVPPPPKLSNVSENPPKPPPSANHNAGGWNDLPAGLGVTPAKTTVHNPSPYSYQLHGNSSRASFNGNITRVPSRPPSRAPTVLPPKLGASGYPPNNNPGFGSPHANPAPGRSVNPYAPKTDVGPNIPTPSGPNFQNSVQSRPMSPRNSRNNPYAPSAVTTPTPRYGFPPQGSQANLGQLASPSGYPQPPQQFGTSPYDHRSSNVSRSSLDGRAMPPPPPPMVRRPSAQRSGRTSVPPPPPHVTGASPMATPSPQPHSSAPPPLVQPKPTPIPANMLVDDQSSPVSESAQSIIAVLSTELDKVKPNIPEQFARPLADTEKRLDILFGHLKRGDLLGAESTELLHQLADTLARGDFAGAKSLQEKISASFPAECGDWMVGVRRLIGMSKAVSTKA